jgi:hypothetical protein
MRKMLCKTKVSAKPAQCKQEAVKVSLNAVLNPKARAADCPYSNPILVQIH